MQSDSGSERAQRTRILIVAPSLDILGGQAVQAARLINRLRHEPNLIIGFLPINPRLPGILRRLQSIKYLRTVVTSIAYIISLLAQVRRYDIIHVFSASYFSFVLAPTPAILVGRVYRKKILLNYHSGEAEDHLQRWRRSAIPTIRLVDKVAVPSEFLVDIFAKFGIQARAVYNLIEVEKFPFRHRIPLRPAFLSNRNLEAHYGVDRVLRAFAVVQQQFPNATLTVVGDGSERRSLEQLARDLQLRNTRFVGRIEHDSIGAYYDAADIYLNASEIDNQPLSVLEAFACGLVVITTDAGAIGDMIKNGKTGFVVSRGDYKALGETAIELLKNPVLAGEIARRAREECRNYSWEKLRATWLNCYEDLVSGAIKLHDVPVRNPAPSKHVDNFSSDEYS